MAISLDTGVPWIMCQQKDAPDPIVCLIFFFPIVDPLARYYRCLRALVYYDGTCYQVL